MKYNKEELSNVLSIFEANFKPVKAKLKVNAYEKYVGYYGSVEVDESTHSFFNKHRNKEMTFIIDYPTSYYFLLEDNNICLPSICIDFKD